MNGVNRGPRIPLTNLPARMPHVSIPSGRRSVLVLAIFSNSLTRVEGRISFLRTPNALKNRKKNVRHCVP